MSVVCFTLEQLPVACEVARLSYLVDHPFVLAEQDTVRAASAQAQNHGIAPGQALTAARAFCSSLIVLPYDPAACEIAARPLWDAIATESDIVEPVSPELCYAVFQGKDIQKRVQHLVSSLARSAGFPIRAGIGRTRFIARHAARRHDKNQPVVYIAPIEENAFLATVPLTALPDLDQKTCRQMEKLGIHTLGDLNALSPHRLPQSLQKVGKRLTFLARGTDFDPVQPLWPPRSLHDSHAFEEDTNDRNRVEAVLQKMAERFQHTLARNREYCREVRVQVCLSDGSCLESQRRLLLPESRSAPLFRACLRLLEKLPIEQPLQAITVTLTDLGTGSGVQLSLMDEEGELPHERKRRLEAALEYLRRGYGSLAVFPARLLLQARRIHLWASPLGHLLHESVQVATDEQGLPVRYWRSARPYRARAAYEVVQIQDRWRETFWQGVGHSLDLVETFRVETAPWGVSELCHQKSQWRLTGIMD